MVFAYSDVSHETVMHAASRVLAAGATFTLLGPDRTMLTSRRPVLAVGATRTGAGKSQTTRYLAGLLAARGLTPVVIRHPMPYGDLVAQRVERFATLEDLDRYDTTIEEREEYEPHLDAGRVVYAGVDYEAILRAAELEADVILWDGGNNDFPFYRPDLNIVVADPLRAGDERRYHPGETNLRMADVIIINKIDSATPEQIDEVRASIEALNPKAQVVTARSDVTLDGPPILGKRVVVVEDGPTLTHGGMAYGAGVVAARRFGAGLVDPAPGRGRVHPDHAGASTRTSSRSCPRWATTAPRSRTSRRPSTPSTRTSSCRRPRSTCPASSTLNKPITRARYNLAPIGGPALDDVIEPIVRLARLPAPAVR